MINKVFLNKKIYWDVSVAFLACYSIPIYLLFHWEKVTIGRYQFVSAFCSLIFILVIRRKYKFFKDFKRIKDLTYCEGKIKENHSEGGKHRICRPEIEIVHNSIKFRFIAKEFRSADFNIGSITPVLLDIKSPEKSIALEFHPYLKISK